MHPVGRLPHFGAGPRVPPSSIVRVTPLGFLLYSNNEKERGKEWYMTAQARALPASSLYNALVVVAIGNVPCHVDIVELHETDAPVPWTEDAAGPAVRHGLVQCLRPASHTHRWTFTLVPGDARFIPAGYAVLPMTVSHGAVLACGAVELHQPAPSASFTPPFRWLLEAPMFAQRARKRTDAIKSDAWERIEVLPAAVHRSEALLSGDWARLVGFNDHSYSMHTRGLASHDLFGDNPEPPPVQFKLYHKQRNAGMVSPYDLPFFAQVCARLDATALDAQKRELLQRIHVSVRVLAEPVRLHPTAAGAIDGSATVDDVLSTNSGLLVRSLVRTFPATLAMAVPTAPLAAATTAGSNEAGAKRGSHASQSSTATNLDSSSHVLHVQYPGAAVLVGGNVNDAHDHGDRSRKKEHVEVDAAALSESVDGGGYAYEQGVGNHSPPSAVAVDDCPVQDVIADGAQSSSCTVLPEALPMLDDDEEIVVDAAMLLSEESSEAEEHDDAPALSISPPKVEEASSLAGQRRMRENSATLPGSLGSAPTGDAAEEVRKRARLADAADVPASNEPPRSSTESIPVGSSISSSADGVEDTINVAEDENVPLMHGEDARELAPAMPSVATPDAPLAQADVLHQLLAAMLDQRSAMTRMEARMEALEAAFAAAVAPAQPTRGAAMTAMDETDDE